MATYSLTRRADADLEAIYRFGISRFGLQQADRYFDSLIVRFCEIAANPMSWQASEYREGYRRSVHPPHTVYFRIVGPEHVEIVRILRAQAPRYSL